MNPLWYVLEFIVGGLADYEHSKEWDKKICTCSHKYHYHEQAPDKKRPINACNKCSCYHFEEDKK